MILRLQEPPGVWLGALVAVALSAIYAVLARANGCGWLGTTCAACALPVGIGLTVGFHWLGTLPASVFRGLTTEHTGVNRKFWYVGDSMGGEGWYYREVLIRQCRLFGLVPLRWRTYGPDGEMHWTG